MKAFILLSIYTVCIIALNTFVLKNSYVKGETFQMYNNTYHCVVYTPELLK